MDMDIDWCLTCNKRVEGASLYCSLKCQFGAGPSNYHQRSLVSLSDEQHSSYDDADEYADDYDGGFYYDYDEQISNIEAVSKTTWAGRGSAGIRAWAAEIPLGAPPEVQQQQQQQDLVVPPATTTPPRAASSDDTSSVSSTSSTTSSTYRAPNLVRPSRPVPPSLTMSKPDFSSSATTPPRPILTLQNHLAAISLSRSPGSTARTSIISEDSLPTPGSTHPISFSPLPGRPFPSISDARASDLAACTRLNSPSTTPSHCLPIAIASSSQHSSLVDDDAFDSFSPPWWVTSSMVAPPPATKAATPHIRSSAVRKDTPTSIRGRRTFRVVAA